MKEHIIEIDGEKVYLKKSMFGFRIIHPIKIDGKINYINLFFGGYANLFKLLTILLLAVIIYFGVTELINSYKLIALNPCDYCNQVKGGLNGISYNLSLYP